MNDISKLFLKKITVTQMPWVRQTWYELQELFNSVGQIQWRILIADLSDSSCINKGYGTQFQNF